MPEAYILPLRTKILYSVGQLGVNVTTFFVSSYLLGFYAPTNGTVILNRVIVGAAYAIGTSVQAVANPFLGNVSDRMVSKYGRRRFFMVTGFLPLSILFALIWFPIFNTFANEILLFIYMVGFNFLYAYVVLPYLSLIPEIATDTNDRVRLTTISAEFAIFGLILASVMPLIFDISEAGLALAILTLFSFLIAFFFTKERHHEEASPKEYTFVTALVKTFQNRTFAYYIVAYMFFQFGFYFFLGSLSYFVENIVVPGNKNWSFVQAELTLAAVLSAVIFSPVLVRYTTRRGEKKAFIRFTIFLGLVMTFTYAVGLFHGISPFLQALIVVVFAGFGLTSYFILPNAIISEIIDEDELRTGYRREAMYFGVQGFLERIPSGVSVFAVSVWVQYTYVATNNLVFIRMLGVIGGIFTILTGICFIFVPLKQGIKKQQMEQDG